MGNTPAMVLHCFVQACVMPEDTCFYSRDVAGERKPVLKTCEGGRTLTTNDFRTHGRPRSEVSTVVAVVQGKPLVVEPVSSLTRATVKDMPTCTTCAANDDYATVAPHVAVIRDDDVLPAPVVDDAMTLWAGENLTDAPDEGLARDAPSPVPPLAPVPSPPVRTTPIVSAPPVAPPVSPPAASVPTASSDVVLRVPEPPANFECRASDALRKESRRHVDLGDEAQIAGTLQKAVDEYQAAIAIDRCDGFAWANLGSVALRTGHALDAVRALEAAVELMPNHYRALTDLGDAYESLKEWNAAEGSYREALHVQPNHLAAMEGLKRVLAQTRGAGP